VVSMALDQVRGLACALPLTLLLALPAQAGALVQKLNGPEADPLGGFGYSVAIDGDTAVVGMPFSDQFTGIVYVFSRQGNEWVRTGELSASDAETSDQLGWAVGIDGDTIVAGALDDEGTSEDVGAVYTFARTGPLAPKENAKLTAPDATHDDGLGWSVAIDGDTIVAGAPGRT